MGYAQQTLKGLIVADSLDNYQVNIVNINNKQGTTNLKSGEFVIPAQVNDSIVFSSVKHDFAYHIVKDSDFNHPIKIKLSVAINELEEVVLSQYDLTGDIAKDANEVEEKYIDQAQRFGFAKPRRLTPVQREVYAVQTSGPLAVLMMHLNGQMASLKRRIKFAENQQNQRLVLPYITDSLLLNFFKLELDYKDDFAYYCAEDPELLSLVRQKDRLRIMEAIKAKVAPYRKTKYVLRE